MSISKRRIGTTLSVELPILTEGESTSLLGRDITVVLASPRGIRKYISYDITDGNILSFVFQGKDQKSTGCGVYSIEVYENFDKEMQTVFDKPIFELVPLSSMEDDGIDGFAEPLISIQPGCLSFGGGQSAYQIAVEHGFVGTVDEWLASLKGEHGVPGQDGKDGIDGRDGVDGRTPTLSFEVDESGYLKLETDI